MSCLVYVLPGRRPATRGHALPMEEPEKSAALDEALRRWITLITRTTAIAPASSERGMMVEADGTHLEGERLVVATGRWPNRGSLASLAWVLIRPGASLFLPTRTSAQATACGRWGR